MAERRRKKATLVLEEVDEKNQLVPGTPDNPVRLGERMKKLLVTISLCERDGRAYYSDSYGRYQNDDGESFERLRYLNLIKSVPYEDPKNADRKKTIAELRKKLRAIALNGTPADLNITANTIYDTDRAIKSRSEERETWVLTEAGKALMLSGKVTLSL